MLPPLIPLPLIRLSLARPHVFPVPFGLPPLELTDVCVPILIHLVPPPLPQVLAPLTLIHASSLVQQHPDTVSAPVLRDLTHIDRIIIELDATVILLSDVKPLLLNEFTLWLVILDRTQLLLSG